MSSILTIQFPEDFEERYRKYRASLEIDNEDTAISDQKVDDVVPAKKYHAVKEPFKIKGLAIEISDKLMIKGDRHFQINHTEKILIYFLYFKYTENGDECFGLDRLIAEPGFDGKKKSEGYIKNAISRINKGVKQLVVNGKTNIGDFIKNEPGRGYHLNPKLMLVTK